MFKNLLAILLVLFSIELSANSPSDFKEKLSKLEGVVSVEQLSYDEEALPFIKEKYCVIIEQTLSPNNTQTFNQRFVISHSGYDKPVIFVTEGYAGAYALREGYSSELARHYQANEVVVEHRFFEKSMPDITPIPWEYMRGVYAADDLHKINQELRTIYTDSKFVTTGISKGGQTTMFYKMYYPEDADVAVPYVAPLCFGVEDGRHEPFIERCGTESDRKVISDFQTEILKRRPQMSKLLKEYVKKKELTFRTINIDELLDYCVLEASFAIWQWGTPISTIPAPNADDDNLFEALMTCSGPEYFAADSPTQSFFVQALGDLGYYGYDTKPFKDLLVIKNTKDYLRNIFVPIEAKDTKFNKKQAKLTQKYLQKNDPKIIFIYGEYDPWSAAAADDKLFEGKTNMKKFVEPKADHSIRIKKMEKNPEIFSILDAWILE